MSIHPTSRIVLIALITTLLAACSRPGGSNDTASASPHDKIVGTWEFIALGTSVQQTYSNNGGCRLVVTPIGSSQRISQPGTWSLEGNRLRINMATQSVLATILKLEDSVLVYEATNKHGDMKATTWKRIK